MKNVEDVYPLAPTQQGVLFHVLSSSDRGLYVEQLSWTLTGELSLPTLEAAWKLVVARHPTLRTAFLWEGLDQPLQIVRREVRVPLEQQDWSALTSAEQEARFEELLHQERRRGFELSSAPLLRLVLTRLAPDTYRLIWSFHHLLLDGWSYNLVLGEVFVAYATLLRGEQPRLSPARPYRDYIAWLQAQALAGSEAFWREALAGFEAPTPLGFEPAAAGPGTGAETRLLQLTEVATANLQSFAARQRLTLNTLVQGAWALLLARYSGEPEVVFGAVTAGRPEGLAGVGSMVGLFINTVPVRVRVPDGAEVAAWLRELREQQVRMQPHEHVPLARIQEWSEVPRGLALFESILAFENVPSIAAALQRDGAVGTDLDLRFSGSRYDGNTNFPLDVTASPGPRLLLRLLHDPLRFPAVAARTMLEHLARLLEALPLHPQRPLGMLPMLSETERRQLLVEWNDSAAELPREPLARWFEAQAVRTPEAEACSEPGRQLTYRELDRRASRLARALAARGVSPETLVALLAPRGIDLLTAVLAVFKAGGAYLPLDPLYPAERLRQILERSGSPLILVADELRPRLKEILVAPPPADRPWPSLLPLSQALVEPWEETPLAVAAPPESLAYVIYTSGSTGLPKGVMVEHRGMLNHLWAKVTDLRLSASDVVAQTASQTFDISVWQFLAALLVGGRVHIVREEAARIPELLLAEVEAEGVTVLEVVPSFLQAVVEEPAIPPLGSVRWLLVTGEALPPDLCRRWLEVRPWIPLLNAYGPTECSDDVTHWLIDRTPPAGAARVPIGRPVCNVALYVVGRELSLAPSLAAGELVVGGVCVGRGYLGEPGRTAEVFVPDLFSGHPGDRLYRTGDRVRSLPGGELDFLGRIDFQVKVRGFRIELGEIEAQLLAHPEVRQAVVLVRDQRLVAYVVPIEGRGGVGARQLREVLSSTLPDYMIPAAFVFLNALPLTAHGKLDRKALPAPEVAQVEVERAYVAPRNGTEMLLAQVWAQVLKRERVGILDNFFELGGDSILSLQVAGRARSHGLVLNPAQIFAAPTVAELALVARRAARNAPAEQRRSAGPVPLTPIQSWFLTGAGADPHHFNLGLSLEARHPLDAGRLRRAIVRLVEHHDSLRLRFALGAAGWVQWIAPREEAELVSGIDLGGLPAARREEAAQRAATDIQSGLDLGRGPLLRVALFHFGAGEPEWLLWAVHHLAVDGVSWRILLEDLVALYDRPDGPLPPKTSPFKQWAERLQALAISGELAAELGYWTAAERRRAACLPVDHQGGANTVRSASTHTVSLTAEETRTLLEQVPRISRFQIEDLLLAALGSALARWTGKPLQLIDVEGHEREELADELDLSRTVGWLTVLYPLLLEIDPSREPGASLKAVKEHLRRVPRRSLAHGVLRYLAQDPASLTELPPAQVLFNYLGRLDLALPERFQASSRPGGMPRSPWGERRHLLEVNASVAGGRLDVAWTYSAALHEPATIAALADGFLAELRRVLAACLALGAQSLTPSDVPLARLGQAELERIAAESPDLQDLYPLSPTQEGMLFHVLADPEAPVYFEQLVYSLRGEVDLAALRRAWQRVVEHNPVLRTTFLWDGLERPHQMVRRRADLPWRELDWRDRPEWRGELEELVAADRAQGFRLDEAPLLRFTVVRTGEGLVHVVWSFHHLLLDGWSLPLLLREVSQLYGAFARGGDATPESRRPYRDYIAWLALQEMDAAEAFWRRELAGFSEPTPLPGDRGAGLATRPGAHGSRELRLAPAATAAVQAVARRLGLTLNSLVQGAWALLLGRYSGERDLVYGSVFAGRPLQLEGADQMVGLFINTLPVRVRTAPGTPLSEWLRAFQEHHAELRQYEHVPLPQVLGWSEVGRGAPLFESVVAFENYPVEPAVLDRDGSLEVASVRIFESTNYPLNLVAAPGAGLLLRVLFDQERFEPALASRLVHQMAALLEAMSARPELPLDAVSLLSEAERRQLLEWAGGERFPVDSCLHELFASRAAAAPDRVAAVFVGERLSYGELARRSRQLARRLRTLSVGPETLVALYFERSLEMVVAILGVLEAGGAYLPLDPAYPEERLAFALKDSGAPVLLTHERLAGRVPAFAAQVLVVDAAGLESESAEPLAPRAEPAYLAYVIYTSGSTGRPKGVLVRHGEVVRLLRATERWYGFGSEDVWTLFHSYAFDFSVWELWGALLYGGRLVVVPYWVSREPGSFCELLVEEGVTVLNQTPSAFRQLIRAEESLPAPARRAIALREVIFGGEVLELRSLVPWFERHGDRRPRLVNMYGITETTVHVTYRPVGWVDVKGGSVIGRPIPDLSVYLLDAGLSLVPIGMPGEIFVGSAGVARGYLGRPELTAERFVPDPFGSEPGGRLYRSGDLGRYRPDGDLEYLGRIDNQVKIRGFRIELGEIESVLASHPGVLEAVVLAREDMPGDRRLVAYLVAGPEGASAEELRAQARARLPEYMVPSAFVFLESLPLTANGKLDRKALPAPQRGGEAGYEAPRTAVEEILAGIWAEVLGVDRVGAEDDFFELGGHSLLATRVFSRLRQSLSVDLPLRALFEAPTVAALATRVAEAREGGTVDAGPPIVPVPRKGVLPLSYAQQRLWFLEQFEPGSAIYNLAAVVRVEGDLAPALVERCLALVAARHEALRTRFPAVAGEPVQLVLDRTEIGLPLIDLSALPDQARERTSRALAADEAARPFDIVAGPLLRTTLVRVGRLDHLLLLAMHHIVSDGWSMDLLVREVSAAHAALRHGEQPALPELPVQYADFAVWQRRWLRGEVLEGELAFWVARLAGAPPVLEIPADRLRPPVKTFRGRRVYLAVDRELTIALRALARREGVTLFMILLAAFDLLLHRYSGQQDLVVGTLIANRNRVEIERLIGFFVNTLALRSEAAPGLRFRELLGRTRSTALDAYAHQDLPFEKLVEELHPERDLSRSPVFQVLFTLQNAAARRIETPGLILRHLELDNHTAKFDLTLSLEETDEELTGALIFNSDLFDPVTARRLAAHFIAVAGATAAAPDLPLAGVPLLSPAEVHQVRVEWNAPSVCYRSEATLHDLVEAQAARTPGALAVFSEAGSLTYADLYERACRLARYLVRQGVGPETVVGVCLERSPDMVVALLAVLQAGGAYLPLDPDYPRDRLAYMLDNSRSLLVLTQERLRGLLPVAADGVSPAVSLDHFEIPREEGEVPADRGTGPDNLAYVMYTSGSTGRPKGVMIPHRGICNRLLFAIASGDVTAESRFLHKTSISFDVSLIEVFAPLLAGGCTVLARPGGQQDIAYLVRLMAEQRVTHAIFAPSAFQVLLAQKEISECWNLRAVACSAEVMPVDLQKRFYELLGAELYNRYGPTEASVAVTSWRCRRDGLERSVPIGRPIAQAEVYLLDRHLHPVPVGVPGELYIGGVCLGRGYLDRPGETAARFVPHPFATGPGERLYATGDLAKYRSDGAIEFLGRVDHQVKIRGFRVEIGEIESHLEQLPELVEAVVQARDDIAGGVRLVAYVVGREGETLDPATLRETLRKRVPEYMVPSYIVRLSTLPRLPNGKVDRKALPPPRPEADFEAAFVAPRGPIEDLIAQIWREVLAVERVGVHDNFFDLGGHSLLATQVVSRICTALEVELPLRRLFETPTVAGLAAGTQETRRGERKTVPPLRPYPRSGEIPLSFAQERIWFLDRFAPGNPALNMAAAVRLTGRLYVAAVRAALATILDRHEALRTHFQTVDGRPIQVIDCQTEVALPVVDLTGIPAEMAPEEAGRLAAWEADRPFDLARDLLLRTTLLRERTDRHLLLLAMHHIGSDGWSVGVFVREMAILYDALSQNRLPHLPPLPIQYADFARWQREWLRTADFGEQMAYWRTQLADRPAALALPADRPRPAVQTSQGARHGFLLAPDLLAALRAVGRERGGTLFMILLAGYKALLLRLTGQDDLVVGSPIANRNRPEVEALIGMFFNLLALRTSLAGAPGFAEMIGRVRQVTLEAFSHQDLPFEKLLDQLQPERSLRHTPIFQTTFVLQNSPLPVLELPGLTLALQEVERRTANFDLTLFLSESDEGLRGAVEYRTDIFDHLTIIRLCEHLRRLLEGVIAEPLRPLSELPLLGTVERHQLTVEWNDTSWPLSPAPCIQRLFEAQARRTPEAVAVISGADELRYAELDRLANRLARLLVELGVRRGDPVGIYLERSLEMVPALLAVLKAGGFYVPIDTSFPAGRVHWILSSVGVRCLLTQSWLCGAVERCGPLPDLAHLLCLDRATAGVPGQAVGTAGPRIWTLGDLSDSAEALELAGEPSDPAYVIFTSGSTGTPKGVMVRHEPVLNLIEWVNETYDVGPADRVLFITSLSFDLSVYDVFGLLAAGGSVRVASREEVEDPTALVAALRDEPITFWDSAPAALQQLVPVLPAATSSHLRLVFLSGDWIPLALPDQVRQAFPSAEVIGLGGATEATVWSNFFPVRKVEPSWMSIPYGRPIRNARYHVLDSALEPCLVRVEGDLFIAGPCLSSGYFNDPAQSAERFLPDPFGDEPGGRMYRTGDRARVWPDGTIEFLGRVDQQVKIRGFRIELGEIEAVLTSHPGVRDAVVLARSEDESDVHRGPAASSRWRLVAYVVPGPGGWAAGPAGEDLDGQVSHWQAIYDQTYSQPPAHQDPTFNIIGWVSSYTGELIPEMEMLEWVDRTVERILSLRPLRVIEIGCGTGMLLFRVAPHCNAYIGTDISAVSLRAVATQLAAAEPRLDQVTLLQMPAHDWSGIEPGFCDLVVLNSVTQHFPSIEYLLRVIESAVAALGSGGRIYIGDVRSLPLLEAFHASVQLAQAPAGLTRAQFLQRARQRILHEEELVVDPAFFAVLPSYLPALCSVRVELRRGRIHNELTRFRYDVVLEVGEMYAGAAEAREILWRRDALTLGALRQLLAEEKPPLLAVRGIPNARVWQETAVLEWMRREDDGELSHLGDLRASLQAGGEQEGCDPEDLWDLGEELPYDVQVTWSAQGEGLCDAFFTAADAVPGGRAAAISRMLDTEPPWSSFGTDPCRAAALRRLVPELRRHIGERLPEYMMPAVFVLLESLPVTANGKLDRRALPEPEAQHSEREEGFVAPSSEVERVLAEIWAEVLGVDRVGVDDNFFELGGDSILSIQVIARAAQAGIQISPGQLFQYQTITELTAAAGSRRSIAAEQGEIVGPVLLTPIQRWFFAQEVAERWHWNLPLMVELRRPLEPAALADSVRYLLRHHDVLRARFERSAEGWSQILAPFDGAAPVTTIDLEAVPSAAPVAALEAAASVQASLDLAAGPLVRFVQLRFGSQQPNLLLLVAHHLVTDGVSWRILLEDLQTVYQQVANGQEVRLPAKSTSYRDWAERLAALARSEELAREWDYWLETTRGADCRLPVVIDPLANTEGALHSVVLALDMEETRSLLQEANEAYQSRALDLLLTALILCLEKWTGAGTLLVELEGHGREEISEDIDVSRTVGWFTSIYPVLLELGEERDPGSCIKRVKEQMRRLPRRGLGFGLLRYLSGDERAAQLPRAEVIFNYLGQFDQAISNASLFRPAQGSYGPARSPRAARYHLIEVWCAVVEDRLRVNWVFCEALREVVEPLAQKYLQHLNDLITHCLSPEAGGFTPSDFMGADLSQAELDKILIRLS